MYWDRVATNQSNPRGADQLYTPSGDTPDIHRILNSIIYNTEERERNRSIDENILIACVIVCLTACLSVFLSVHLSAPLFELLSDCISLRLSISPSVYPSSVVLFVCMSVLLFVIKGWPKFYSTYKYLYFFGLIVYPFFEVTL